MIKNKITYSREKNCSTRGPTLSKKRIYLYLKTQQRIHITDNFRAIWKILTWCFKHCYSIQLKTSLLNLQLQNILFAWQSGSRQFKSVNCTWPNLMQLKKKSIAFTISDIVCNVLWKLLDAWVQVSCSNKLL